jgi:hypothetical protein
VLPYFVVGRLYTFSQHEEHTELEQAFASLASDAVQHIEANPQGGGAKKELTLSSARPCGSMSL